MFKQVLLSINYCHSQNIAHRDLKPENFIYETNDPTSDLKVIDFGLSKVCNTLASGKIEKLGTKAGTPYYISPEVLTGNYDSSCDLWSAGCILYILLCGYPPFYGDSDAEILGRVRKGVYSMEGEEWEEVSKEAKDLIKKLICKPEVRLTAAEALEHKWFRKFKGASEKQYLRRRNLRAFKNYIKANKLQQAAQVAIAVQASPKDIASLKGVFTALDKNQDG